MMTSVMPPVDRTAESNEPGHGARQSQPLGVRPRLLVAIANHGTKNRHFLDRLLSEYRAMASYDVDIVVLSNIPKDLGPDVEVRVGLPIPDPWSLPFGHKQLFAERADDYDLFIYTEDDTLISERNIRAFEEETGNLPSDCIAGFIRFEEETDGRRYYSSMHSHFHWEQDSVVRHGNSLFAYYTNEHAACFILTRQQLKRAIASGGFLLPPRKGHYDMLVTAATDPYTQCGLRKLVCISRIDDFCLHHLPNVYCGKLGLDVGLARLEISKLHDLSASRVGAEDGPLFEPYPLRDGDFRNKKYYEHRRDDVLAAVPHDAKTVLSIGCGCATTEAELVKRGVAVTAVPLDAVIRTSAEAKGIETLPSNFQLAAEALGNRRFDCIMILDILQQLEDPQAILGLFGGFLAKNGSLLVSVPNWNYHIVLRKRLSAEGREALSAGASARKPGVHPTTSALVSRWLRKCGFRRLRRCEAPGPRVAKISKWTFGLANEVVCRNIVLLARR